MAIVSLAAPPEGQTNLKAEVNKVLAPFAEMFSPAPSSLMIYLGQLYPAGPELGVNPHPALLCALAEWAYEAGVPEVRLAARAAPGFEFAQSWQLAGYGALESYGAAVLDLAREPRLPRESRLALACRELSLPRPLLQAEALINVGKFRAAEGRLFGSALTNLAAMADLPAEDELFPRALVDLHSVVVPDLHVLDALRGEKGWQPQAGNALLAATDACALDMTLAALAGLPGGRIEQIALAAQYGLGSATAADIQLVGDALALFDVE